MGQRIHAGADGDEFGHADGKFGIGNHHLGHHQRVEDYLFSMGGLVGDDAGAADFRAGAGRGRHGDDGENALGIGAGPPVADILEIPHWPCLAGHEGDDLADIEPRAAAKGDDAIMAALAEHLDAGLDIGRDRVGFDLGEDADGNAGILEERDRLSIVFCVTGRLTSPASVTSSGLAMPAVFRASGSSAMRPGPNLTAVG
ncbi:MAG: hypothetical protein B7Z15_19740 [Rhizobiales bacterium 32-66-8]|nr:MAG: hypothetical protein B7Z15_19740 [Rhizobiales bacterium 32-66-8]